MLLVLAVAFVTGIAAFLHDRAGRRSLARLERAVDRVAARASALVAEASSEPVRALDGTPYPGRPSAVVTGRFAELFEALESAHPSHREPEALVDAPWNWGRNHPPIVFPYLKELEPYLRDLEELLGESRPDLAERPQDLVLRGGRRFARLFIADAWRQLVGEKNPGAAAHRVVLALEIADRLDDGSLESHRIRVDSVLRSVGMIRWVFEADGVEPAALRSTLDRPLAEVAERTRFDRALAGELASLASMPELRDRFLADPGLAGWLGRPRRATRVRGVLDQLGAALDSVGRPYPEARPALDDLEKEFGEPRSWQTSGRFDPGSKLREFERTIEVEAQAALARTVLALGEHRAERGDVPGQLEALAPKFEQGLPVDPRTGAPFLYEFDDDATARVVPAPARDLGPKGRYDRPRVWTLHYETSR